MPPNNRQLPRCDVCESTDECLDGVRRSRSGSFTTRVCKHRDAQIARGFRDRSRDRVASVRIQPFSDGTGGFAS